MDPALSARGRQPLKQESTGENSIAPVGTPYAQLRKQDRGDANKTSEFWRCTWRWEEHVQPTRQGLLFAEECEYGDGAGEIIEFDATYLPEKYIEYEKQCELGLCKHDETHCKNVQAFFSSLVDEIVDN